MKVNRITTALVILLFLLPVFSLLAQGPPSGPPSGPGSSGAPIDGGAILLLASAAAYGFNKLNAKTKVPTDNVK